MRTTPKRRWFQISIRDAALILVALGFALAWYGEHKEWEPVKKCIADVRDGGLSRAVTCDIGGRPVTVLVTGEEVVWVQDRSRLVEQPVAALKNLFQKIASSLSRSLSAHRP